MTVFRILGLTILTVFWIKGIRLFWDWVFAIGRCLQTLQLLFEKCDSTMIILNKKYCSIIGSIKDFCLQISDIVLRAQKKSKNKY